MNEQSTNLLEQRLGEALDAMVAGEVEAPPAVTVADLIESGRRQIRRRRGRGRIGLGVVTATAMAVTIGVVAGNGPGHVATGLAKGASTASATATSPVPRYQAMETSGDPAAPIIAFGWLPPTSTGAYGVFQSVTGPDRLHPTDPKTGWSVDDGPGTSAVQAWGPRLQSIAASVQGPGPGTVPGATSTPAGLVQGHQASWVMGAPGSAKAAALGSLDLMWQYEPGAWATVTLDNAATGAANGEMLLKVARNLKIGPANPAPMPLHLPALPAGLHVDAADVNLQQQHGSQAGAAALRLCVVSPCDTTGGVVVAQDSTTWMLNSTFAVANAPQVPFWGGHTPSGGTPVSVGGHSALLWTKSNSATVSFTYETVRVIIQAAGSEYQALGGKDGFLAFCRSLTWLGADPARWTTRVVG